MNSMNHVVLMGHLTRDPELRKVASGAAVSDLGLALNERYKDKDGEVVTRPTFVDVVAWGKQAEHCAQYLKKGAPVAVEGKLQFDQWETAEGEKRSKLRVRAWRVQFLNGGKGASTATENLVEAAAEAADDPDF